MRMAERQIWRIVADRPQGVARTDTGQRPGKITKGFQSHAENEED
jgi:hypothetical protein